MFTSSELTIKYVNAKIGQWLSWKSQCVLVVERDTYTICWYVAQMNVIFVAIEDTVEVFRRSQAMQMEVLSICTMPKQLHPVSMYTEHQVCSCFLL